MNTPIQQDGSRVRADVSVRGRKWVHALALIPVMGALVISTAAVGKDRGESGSLAGSWSGGGWVSFSSGNKEKARCRASYRRNGGDSYTLEATCATSSGKASQTATVYKVSGSAYRGSFYNIDYNVRGTIRVVVSGSSQSVSLAGDGASASLSLHKH
jgi:hypothetical protein